MEAEIIKRNISFELTATIIMVNLDMSEPLPGHLRKKILADSKKFFASGEKAEIKAELQKPFYEKDKFSRLSFYFFGDKNISGNMNLIVWQIIYVLGGIALLPFAPFLYLQGQYVRRKVGRLPDASGATKGKFGTDENSVKLLILGESTAAGVGARTHETGLAGHFARSLSAKIGKSIEWQVIGRSGITVKETIRELVPKIPDEKFDYILVALCGNEVLKLRSPRTFRRDMRKLLGILKERNEDATFFMTNAPAVRLSPILPFPIKSLLGHLSAMHDANAREFTAEMKRVYYFHQPTEVPEDFFADGIHPSEKGYEVWSKRMIEFFGEEYQW